MVGVCCGCIAKPASVQPRKTYNILIGQLFAGEPISTEAPIDSSLRRKIQKLQEYVQANPAKIPKVSRRLMRRIKATLRRPGDNLGYVKVAVHSYVYLLARSTEETSSYSPSFFAREVVSGPDAVVPLLLKDLHIEMRTLGAELLAVFTKVQSQVDNKLDSIQSQVPQVCRAAQAALSADRKEQKLQETVERRRAGDKLAVPNPLDLVARRDPAHVSALEVACLRCLGEVVALCKRSKVLPKHLTAIQAVMLDNLRQTERGSNGGNRGDSVQHANLPGTPRTPGGSTAGSIAGTTADLTAALPSIVDAVCYKELGIQNMVPLGWQPRQLASELLRLMGSFTRDIATVHKIMDSFYEYLDDKHRWQEQGVVKDVLDMLTSSGSLHQFPIFASLLRHASDSSLSLPDAVRVIDLAASKGASLDECYSLAALSLALTEVPKAWAEQARRAPRVMPMQAFLDLLRVGLPASKDHQLASAALAAAGGPPMTQPAVATGAAEPAANSLALSSAGAANSTAVQQVVPSAGSIDKGDTAAFKQQLAYLKDSMVSAVRLLASQIGTAAELCEALTGVLAAAGAELGLTADSAFEGAISAATGTSSGRPSGAGAVGGNADRGAAVAGDQAAAGQAARLADTAAAAMMVQCAAAATDAFVQQCALQQQSQQQQQLLSPAADTGRSRHDKLLVLSGGVLPGGLLSAALPLLTAGPGVIRRPVQQLLLALLPAAHKGLSSDRQAAALAEATLQELARLQRSEAPAEDLTPAAFAAMDQMLRGCLRGPQAYSSPAVVIGRMLLQQQQQWTSHGFRSIGGGNVTLAHAALLLYNSQLTAVADALGSPGLRSQQLPLQQDSSPALVLTSKGLFATGAAFDSAASQTALAALEQRPPVSQQAQELRAAFLQVPRLVAEYGDQLPQLLDQATMGRKSLAGSGGADKPQPAFNVFLTKRMTSLRRDLVQVSELMRNSMGRIHDITPAAALSNAPSLRGSDTGGAAALKPAGSVTAAAPTRFHSLEPATSVGSFYSAVGADDQAAAQSDLPSPAGSQGELEQRDLTHAAAVAGLADGSTTVSSAFQPAAQLQKQQQDAPVSIDSIELQGLRPAKKALGLSSQVADALKQPSPAGAYVVRDVKISSLASELEPVMQ